MYSHIVLFTLEDPDDIPATVSALRGMQDRIPQLRFLEVGVDEKPGPRSAHIVLITRFDSIEAYLAYHAHPHHQRVLEHMAEVTKSAVKVDYKD